MPMDAYIMTCDWYIADIFECEFRITQGLKKFCEILMAK